jgi:hypothetical protein
VIYSMQPWLTAARAYPRATKGDVSAS